MRRGLIGEHLGHSYSQRIHETLGGYPYELIEVAPQDLDAWMKNKDFAALNVTIPYKKAVIPYLEELDERARRIGAVNTIVNDHGRLIGKNTDYYGCRFMLEQAGIEIQGRKVILLGNGGAAQAVQAVLEDLGAAAIVKVKRNPSPETLTYEEAYRDHSGAQVIVNTSPVGMFPGTGRHSRGAGSLSSAGKRCGCDLQSAPHPPDRRSPETRLPDSDGIKHVNGAGRRGD